MPKRSSNPAGLVDERRDLATKLAVTANTAIRLERCPLHLQADYDLQTALNEAKAAKRRMKRLA